MAVGRRRVGRADREAGVKGREREEVGRRKRSGDSSIIVYVILGIGALVVVGIVAANISSSRTVERKKPSGVKILGEDGRPKPPAPPPAPSPDDLAPKPPDSPPFSGTPVVPGPSAAPGPTPTPAPRPQPASSGAESPASAPRIGVLAIKDADGNSWELDYSAIAGYVTISLDRDSLNVKPKDGKLTVTVIWQQRFEFHPVDCYVPGRSEIVTLHKAVDDRRFVVTLDKARGNKISVVRDTNKEGGIP